MLLDPLFYLLAVPVMFAHGVSKAGFGGAFAVATVPLLSLVVSVPMAAAIALPVYCLMDAVGLWAYRRAWDGHVLLALLPAALLGFGAGILIVLLVDEAALRIGIGLFTLSHVALWAHRRRRLPAGRPAGQIDAWGWGAFAGLASFVAHAGSAVLSMHLLRRGLPAATLVGTSIAFTAGLNQLKIPAFVALGQLDGTTMATAAALMPAALLGMQVGIGLARRVPRATFELVCNALLTGAGAVLVIRGLAA
ncbi:MAG: sulfite exporter TauE/SafE family protein [Alphaproteobacteria bacterium]